MLFMKKFDLSEIKPTKYLFFTGKGGVGKTSIACATAVTLADSGKKVLLVSTDPASNLQDVFATDLSNTGTPIPQVPGLVVANLDPIQAAAEYRESVVSPFRGKLPDAVIHNMEEQLSGSCTVEIAAFNSFSNFLTDPTDKAEYDHIIFDTAPTGHTLRLLQLPSAWSNFISENTHGASCLGQLSGLKDKKEIYKNAMATLAEGSLTTLVLVTRPEFTPINEAERASKELAAIGIKNQILVVNGVLPSFNDVVSESFYYKQQHALSEMPEGLRDIPNYMVPLRAYNITGFENVRNLLVQDRFLMSDEKLITPELPKLQKVIDDLFDSKKRVIFTMGKGGVGKTSIAVAIALGLHAKGEKVHLASTDPAAHLKLVIEGKSGITTSSIDEKEELKRYQEEVIRKAKESNISGDDLAYIEEDMRSPCTQEIAVFRAFAEIVDKAESEIVVIDTAPTGHTLLLLDSTQNYSHEVKRTQGEVPESVKKLLPRLRDPNGTEVIIVTLAETTPVYEAMRLEDDLKRAGIATKWWVIDSSLYAANTSDELLKAKASHEVEWINKVDERSGGNFAVVRWIAEDIKGDALLTSQ
jgi:arsenite-transporting ATPase